MAVVPADRDYHGMRNATSLPQGDLKVLGRDLNRSEAQGHVRSGAIRVDFGMSAAHLLTHS
jgi:hypothetical protein